MMSRPYRMSLSFSERRPSLSRTTSISAYASARARLSLSDTVIEALTTDLNFEIAEDVWLHSTSAVVAPVSMLVLVLSSSMTAIGAEKDIVVPPSASRTRVLMVVVPSGRVNDEIADAEYARSTTL